MSRKRILTLAQRRYSQRAARLRNRLTNKALAHRLNVSQYTVQFWASQGARDHAR
jgi:DNA-binding transcriptional regulator YiaG